MSDQSPAPGPRQALIPAGPHPASLPVCDHYCGTEGRMLKALELQARRGPVFDVTLDGEDGAEVGQERAQATLMAELAASELNRWNRVGVRVHPVDHPAFPDELSILLRRAGERLAYITLPKVCSALDIEAAAREIRRIWIEIHGSDAIRQKLMPPPLHVLIETHGALRHVDSIAAHSAVECLSFGLMDFVSAHRGAIPASAMSMPGQFEHPLVMRAKLAISAAAHGHGKVASHNVVTELKHPHWLAEAAHRACRELAYGRMWSIHPDQIDPIIEAFSPTAAELDHAVEILDAAQKAHWGPIRHPGPDGDVLHDRASYRYWWYVIERAHLTQQPLPELALAWLNAPHSQSHSAQPL